MVNDDIDEYNSLLDNDSYVQKKVARSEMEGVKKVLIAIVKLRFPDLVESAQQRASTVKSVEMLIQLTKQIAVAKDEQLARWVLDTYATKRM